MKRTITIPAAGQKQSFDLQGQSIIITRSNDYKTVEDVPRLNFNGLDPIWPVHQWGTIPSYEGKIKEVVISGTAASAGDQITIVTVNECLPLRLNSGSASGDYLTELGNTLIFNVTDAVQGFSELDLQKNGSLPVAAYIQAREFDVSYSFQVNPDQGTNGHILPAGKRKPAGSIEVTAVPAADETFNITMFGRSVSVDALSAGSLQSISDKIRDAINNNADLSKMVTAANGGNTTVTVTGNRYAETFNGEKITTDAADTQLSIKDFDGGLSDPVEPLKIQGIANLLNFNYINAEAGKNSTLIVTPEF